MIDIQWVGYPKSYTPGRRRRPQVVVLHYTAGSEGPTSAEGGAAYDKRRTDGTSTHYFTDQIGAALQEVPDGDRAHTARLHGNEIGIQIEICGTVQTRAQWLDAVSLATLRTTAGLVAILLQRHGLAFRRLTTAELRRAYYSEPSLTGIVDHNACTLAFPEDDGTHTDLGSGFPWDVFMGMVQVELTGPAAVGEVEDMATVFRWNNEYWISRGDTLERESVSTQVGVASVEMNVVCTAHRVFPDTVSIGGVGYPGSDLKNAPFGWTRDLIDLTFGPVKSTTPAPDAPLTPAEIDAIADAVVGKIGEGFTQTVSLAITGSGSAVTTAAPAGE